MNATRHEFVVNIFDNQIEEASLCLLHTIIFHRTTGKYIFGSEASFSLFSIFLDFLRIRFLTEDPWEDWLL